MFRLLLIVFVTVSLAACGGGGGGGGGSNSAPEITDPGALTLLEGASSVVTISASDPDNNSLSFSIS